MNVDLSLSSLLRTTGHLEPVRVSQLRVKRKLWGVRRAGGGGCVSVP